MNTNGSARSLLVALTSLEQQAILLKEMFNIQVALPAIKLYVKRMSVYERPLETRWILTIPWQALDKSSYAVACSIVISRLQRRYGESFKNHIPCSFNMDHMVLVDSAREGLDALLLQSGFVTPAFIMQTQIGCSIVDIMINPPQNRFILDFFTVSIMLLLYPRIFAHNKQVLLDCGGTGFCRPGNEFLEDYVPSYTIKKGRIFLDVIRITETEDVCTPLGIILAF